MFNKLIEWSDQNYGDLPWRQNRTLYRTLVSEIMLQQTTVGTVLNHFEKFLKRFPTIESLATASEDDVTIEWKGLGYYRRARNLKKACEVLHHEYNNQIPLDLEKLVSISGIGIYTASALISIGANERALAVDANLERVLSRFYGIQEHKGPKLTKKIYSLFSDKKIANELDEFGARKFNEALMDLGRTFCKARSSDCTLCFLSSQCKARKEGSPLNYPIQLDSKKISYDLNLLRIIYKKDGKILVYKKRKDQWLSGQNELPTFILSSEDKTLNQYPKIEQANLALLPFFKTAITKYKIVNSVLYVNQEEFESIVDQKLEDFYWVDPKDGHANLSTASLKALEL